VLVGKITKKDLRERILTLLRSQREEERLIKSLSIKDKLFKHNDFQNAKTIMFYASFDGEVDTFEMITEARKTGKRIALPLIDRINKRIMPVIADDREPLETGPHGINQPKNVKNNQLDISDLDAVIVPGVAFDRQNHRLGRGGGYYDRLLALTHEEMPSFGLAFDFQCVDEIPQIGDHDKTVSFVVHN